MVGDCSFTCDLVGKMVIQAAENIITISTAQIILESL